MKEKIFRLTAAKTFIVMLMAVFILIPAVSAQETIPITIVSVNDFHGALTAEGKNPGAAALAALLKSEQNRNPQGTLTLSAGDMFQGTAESNLTGGKSVLAVMNAIGFEAMALGNHEFDWGLAALENLRKEAVFPFLSANIINHADEKASPLTAPYALIEKNGLKIGVIGLTTLETAYKTKPLTVAKLEFADLAQTVNSLTPKLKAEGAEIIVVLAHIDSAMNADNTAVTGDAATFAAQVKGVDAIISGHSHFIVAGKVNGIPIVQAGYNGQAVGKITLAYSPKEEKVIASQAEVLSVGGAGLAPDPEVASVVAQYLAEIEPVKNEKIGSTVYSLPHNKFEHSVLGQWITDAMRKKNNADIAFLNGGGVRTSLAQGVVTRGNIYQIMPFDNSLFTVEMTGAQIREVLNHGLYNEKIGMLQYSGLKIACDTSRPANERIAAVTMLDGKPLVPNKTYRVVTIDYLIDGGDGYNMFKEGQNISDTHLLTRDMLVDAVKEVKVIKFKGDGRFEQKQEKTAA